MKKKVDIIKILLAIAVAVIALLVRMPSAFLVLVSEEQEDAFTDDSGLPYFTDPDSYYHIRLVDTMLETGKIADTVSSEGEPWDMHSFYPEGRSGVYQPGIVYLTILLWKIFNLSSPIDISRVEFYLPGFMAMFTALVVFAAGCRINGKISGLVASILTGCAPEFVSRTSFGRFDTDIFVVLMNVLLILFLTEMLRSDVLKHKIALACGFLIASLIYADCWAAQFSMLFAGLTIFAGFIYVILDEWFSHKDLGLNKRIIRLFINRETILLIATGSLILLIIGFSMGFSVVKDIFESLSFNMTQEVSDDVLPNMFESISELERPALVPDRFPDWFKGYLLGSAPTVVTGIGGAFAAIASIGGLAVLLVCSIKRVGSKQHDLLQKREDLIYFCVLGLWVIAGLYLTRSGIRFIEMLSVSTGLLAGFFVGWISGRFRFKRIKWKLAGIIVTCILVCAIILPDLRGVFLNVRFPTVTDASANAMRWIKENADDPEAVIESWWDMGYYYESESGHPCLWDGGTQDSVRAILISRAMVTDDMELSYNILKMLASSGNKAIENIMDYTDPKTAFEILWETMLMDTEEACAVISEKCGMNTEEAKMTEVMIHPKKNKEAYLVLTYTMAKQTPMYEYYSDWDFTGTQIFPNDSDDTSLTEGESEMLEKTREGYTMWRLFFELEETRFFTPVYECNDGVEGVRVWKIMSD